MSAVMPQAVADRIFQFMVLEKTGRIELSFKQGRLLGLEVVESVRVGGLGPLLADPDALDDTVPVAQDSET